MISDKKKNKKKIFLEISVVTQSIRIKFVENRGQHQSIIEIFVELEIIKNQLEIIKRIKESLVFDSIKEKKESLQKN